MNRQERKLDATGIYRPNTTTRASCPQDLINAGIVVSNQVVEKTWGTTAAEQYSQAMRKHIATTSSRKV